MSSDGNVKKPSKWDFKRALRMIGVDPNENNIEKLKVIETLATPETNEVTPIIENNTSDNNERVMFGIHEENGVYQVVKIHYNLTEAQICGKYDSEPRAVLERGKLEAEERRNNFKRKQKEELNGN